ncbi:hypothetical protein NXS10_05135 [Streptococcus sp. SQ9-PEA]|uniref:PTS transporter n=2 Tax=Streptococcus sciuri TaxID=2973939 RepID=A0ABT2F7E4_9STRE|nr:hypothetical protein [Streptococcus sciuri]
MNKKKMRKTHFPQSREVLKKEMILKNSYFNRYMLFRYSLALFFFSNIYWGIILWAQMGLYIILPSLLLVLIAWSYAEQFRMYGTQQIYLKRTKQTFYCQGATQILLLALTVMTNQFSKIFPIFADNLSSHLFIAMLLILGILLVLYNLKRIQEISENKDRYYRRFQAIENSYH